MTAPRKPRTTKNSSASPRFLPFVAMLLIIGLEVAVRAAGLVDDAYVAAAPAAGIALMLALRHRFVGPVAVFAAYVLSSSLLDGAPDFWFAAGNTLAATFAANLMRQVYRKGYLTSHTLKWISFMAFGVFGYATCYMLVVVAQIMFTAGFNSINIFALVMEYLAQLTGLFTVGAVVANLWEIKLGKTIWVGSTQIVLALAIAFALLIFTLNVIPDEGDADVLLLLSLPIAFWISKRPNSLPGAVIAFVACYPGLWLIMHHLGSIDHLQMMQTVLVLLVIIIVAQAFHALELDRQDVMKDMSRHRDALEDMVELRNAELSRLIRRSAEETSSRKRFRKVMKEAVSEPLQEIASAVNDIAASDVPDDARHKLADALDSLTKVKAEIRKIVNDPEMTNR